jgi:hypothetical protein
MQILPLLEISLVSSAKLQSLQNPSQINGDNLQNLRHEISITFRNKKRKYMKGKINELTNQELIL